MPKRNLDITGQTPATEGIAPPSPAPPRRRRLWKFFLVLTLVSALAFIGFGAFIDVYGQTDWAKPAQVIIVLGARVEENGHPGDSLHARTNHAVALYSRHFAPKIITTGGLGDYPPTEAEAAASLAMDLGVLPADLLQENASTSTTENARFAARICREHGWTRVIIVSDPYHLWRARRDFAAEGLTVYPSPAKNCRRNREVPLRILWTAREVVAVLRDVVFQAFSH